MNAIGQSRKLTGLVIVIGALLFVLVVGAVCWAVWGVPTELFISVGGLITGSGTAHQGAQMMADRSPNYTTVLQPPVPGGGPKIP